MLKTFFLTVATLVARYVKGATMGCEKFEFGESLELGGRLCVVFVLRFDSKLASVAVNVFTFDLVYNIS
jgi:hypothetical protein